MKRTPITPEIMTKVWNLYKKTDDLRLIAETLEISETSARRVIQLMAAAKNGEDVDAIGGNNHQRQKEFAKSFFGVKEKKEEAPPKVEEEDDSAILLKAHAAIEKQNQLLEKQNELLTRLCESLGVLL